MAPGILCAFRSEAHIVGFRGGSHHAHASLVTARVVALRIQRPGGLRLVDPRVGIVGQHGVALVGTDTESHLLRFRHSTGTSRLERGGYFLVNGEVEPGFLSGVERLLGDSVGAVLEHHRCVVPTCPGAGVDGLRHTSGQVAVVAVEPLGLEQRLVGAGGERGGFLLLHQCALAAAFLPAAHLQRVCQRAVRRHDQRDVVAAGPHPGSQRLDGIPFLDSDPTVSRMVFQRNCRRDHTRPERGRSLIFITDGAGIGGMLRAEPCRQHSRVVAMVLRHQRPGHVIGDVHAAVALGIYADNSAACRSSAAFRIPGSSFPRLEALRRIPRQAFGLKEYVSGTFSSKICDKKDSCPALGNTPELSVEKPVCHGPSVSQVHVGIGPAVFTRRRHLAGRLFDADDLFED